jgi:hypothetical protein
MEKNSNTSSQIATNTTIAIHDLKTLWIANPNKFNGIAYKILLKEISFLVYGLLFYYFISGIMIVMFLWHVFSYFYLPCTSCEWVFISTYLFFTHGFSFFLTQDLRLRFEDASWGPKYKMIAKFWWQVLTTKAYPTQKFSKKGKW